MKTLDNTYRIYKELSNPVPMDKTGGQDFLVIHGKPGYDRPLITAENTLKGNTRLIPWAFLPEINFITHIFKSIHRFAKRFCGCFFIWSILSVYKSRFGLINLLARMGNRQSYPTTKA